MQTTQMNRRTQSIVQMEAMLSDPTFVTSKDRSYGTDPYWREGRTVEVTRAKAARLIVDGYHRPASEQEIEMCRKEREERLREIEKAEQNKKPHSVLDISPEALSSLLALVATANQKQAKTKTENQ